MMVSFLQTIVVTFVFASRFSAGAVIRREGWDHERVSLGPWAGHHHHSTIISSVTVTGAVHPSSTVVNEGEDDDDDSTCDADEDDDSSTLTSVIPVQTSAPSTTSVSDNSGDGSQSSLSFTQRLPTSTSSIFVAASSTTLVTMVSETQLATSSTTQPTSTQEPTRTQSTVLAIPLSSSTSTASTLATPLTSSTQTATFWKPTAGATWQIQISGTVDTTLPAEIYDVDLFDTPTATITTLHTLGHKVICYVSAGSFESWRPDAPSFLPTDKGSPLTGWAGEWWLDTNSPNVRTIMRTRIALAASKGCDGVDPDNVDGYNNANGLSLTAGNAVDYLQFLAGEAHSRGLAIGLKNAGELIPQVLGIMEWGVNESCLEYEECGLSQPFIDAGKPVFHIEYPESAPDVSSGTKSETCGGSGVKGFSTLLKTSSLDAWVDAC